MIMKIAHGLMLLGTLGLAFFGVKYLFTIGHMPVAICIILIVLSLVLSGINSVMSKEPTEPLYNTRSGPMPAARPQGGRKQKRSRAR